MGLFVCLFVFCNTALCGHGRTGAGTREEERVPCSSSPRLCSLSMDMVIPMRHRHFQKSGEETQIPFAPVLLVHFK